jgi:hypothetical protein
MFKAIIWSTVAISASLITAFAMLAVIEGISEVYHPSPPGMDPNDMEACMTHVANYPQWLLAAFAPAWGFTAFVSVWLATRLGAFRHVAHGIAIGTLLFIGAIANMLMLPYPLWFELVNLVAIPLGIWLGIRLAKTPPPGVSTVQSAGAPA